MTIVSNDRSSKLASQTSEQTSEQLACHLTDMQKYRMQEVMKQTDHPIVVEWIRHIAHSQQRHAKLLPPVTDMMKWGDSVGLTFTIKKADKVYGYLYGTTHHFKKRPWVKMLTSLSLVTQARLFECSVLGLERNIKHRFSVEEQLDELAVKRGIATIGIDAENVTVPVLQEYIVENEKEQGLLSKPEELELEQIDPIKELARFVNGAFDQRTIYRVAMVALHSGIIELMRASVLIQDSVTDPDIVKKTAEWDKPRNQAMADNIDVLLKACEKVGHERQEPSPKCFFAIGAAHLIPSPSLPESVVELVAAHGWDVELVTHEGVEYQFPPSSHELTKSEAQRLGQLIHDMHYHPLFARQTPKPVSKL